MGWSGSLTSEYSGRELNTPQPEETKPTLWAALDKAARATGSAVRAAGDATRAAGEAALAAGEAAVSVAISPTAARAARDIAETVAHLAGVPAQAGDDATVDQDGVTAVAADAVSAARIAAASVARVTDAAVRSATDVAGSLASHAVTGTPHSQTASLRERGDSLLYRSSHGQATARKEHPAFEHVLDDIAPDEARILRFLAVAGPQPSIDIRTSTPLRIGSQRLAAGITFIADMAGCASPDRSREYLGNLARLGLIRFSEEPVVDFRRYSLLDAHPEAVTAMHRAKRTIAVYRSIYLSVFGEQFCAECFTTDGYNAGGWAERDPGDHYWGKGPRLP